MQIPEWMEQPARRNIARAEEISQLGYIPNFGPQVAGFSNAQYRSMGNNNQMARAYGMQTPTSDVPEPTMFANGVRGYSSYPLFQQNVNTLRNERPGQYGAIMNQFINPWTGASPISSNAETTQARDETGQMVDLADYYREHGI